MVGNGLITLFGGLLLVAALVKAGTSHGSWLLFWWSWRKVLLAVALLIVLFKAAGL